MSRYLGAFNNGTAVMIDKMSTFCPKRRKVLTAFAGALATLYGGSFGDTLATVTHTNQKKGKSYNSNLLFPLFCVAYVTPDNPQQRGQEYLVARYPLAIVPQDDRKSFKQWRDKVKLINPNITMLGYQIVIEETTVPGPGHERMRSVKESWCTYPSGFVPKVGPLWKRKRIFDPRSAEWQSAFLHACSLTLKSYPYDGLFLDQCSIFQISHPERLVRAEMQSALQKTLTELRKLFPDKILIGNSNRHWKDLNGEMWEDITYLPNKDESSVIVHRPPQVELILKVVNSNVDEETVKLLMQQAHAKGASFGISQTYQQILWYGIFDEVMEAHQQYRSLYY